jgi:hypothetical protein
MLFFFLGINSSATSKKSLKKKREIPSYLKVILPLGASVGFGITAYFT